MIQKYETEPIDLTIGSQQLTLLRVKDLEHWVDREALLRDETEEPPYWAHLWTGSLTLARYIEERIECRELNVLDLGCGLGLTGIVASRKGGKVTFADKESEALAFATRNARLNDCPLFETRLLDFTKDVLDQQFSLILGAEILYDRPTFPALVAFLVRHLSPNGRALLADAKRTNTDDFYRQLNQAPLEWAREEVQEKEDNLPLTVRVVTVHSYVADEKGLCMPAQQIIGSDPAKTPVFLGFCGSVHPHARTNPQPIRNQTGCDTERR